MKCVGWAAGWLAGASLTLLACNDRLSDLPPDPSAGVDSIFVYPRAATVVRGTMLRITAEDFDAGRYVGSTATWSTSDAKKAIVSDSGLVNVLDSGTITSTARRGHCTAPAQIHALAVTFTMISPAQFHTCGLATTGDAF